MLPQYSEIEHLSFIAWEDDPDRPLRHMAMLTAYLDESRTDSGKPYPVVGGYLATVEQWLTFSVEWKSVLKEFEITGFHASPCWANHPDSEFADREIWTREAKQELVGRLLDVIERHALRAIVSSLDHDAYVQYSDERSSKHGSAYELLGESTAVIVGKFAEAVSLFPIALVFDQGNQYRHQFDTGYALMRRGPFSFAKYLGPLAFASDERVMPLQAADLYAWTLARTLHEHLAEHREQETWSVPWAERIWFEVRRLENFIYPSTLARMKDVGVWSTGDLGGLPQNELNRIFAVVKPASERF